MSLAVIAVYGQLAYFDFVFFDDHVYVTEKEQVLAGLSVESFRWAISTTDAGFWHPLTWISLMADHDLWGMNPGGYHLTNVLLHLIATLFLYAALQRLTGAIWKSALVAALFALHPLHVESVAWIAERKDVLSGVFWMLSLWLYARYVEEPRMLRYTLVLLSFLCGLMAKPMVVTLPVVLLLLDIWPLKRLTIRTWRLAVAEKIPFFILGVIAGVVTIFAEQQVGAVKTFAEVPFISRLANATVAYGFYLYRTVWPFDLAVHYPHPVNWPLWMTASSLLVVGAITVFIAQQAKARPFLLVGWLWYLVCLMPVIGLIQIGSHAYADRYSYIPLIGVFIAMVWAFEPRSEIMKKQQLFMTFMAVIVSAAFAVVSWQQVQHWRNGETLFRQAVAVTQNNWLAYNNLGAALSRQERYGDAEKCFTQALKYRPDYPEAYFNMGVALAGQGRLSEALPMYIRVLAGNQNFYQAHNNMGVIYAQTGNFDKAIAHFREAIRIHPDYSQAIQNLKKAESDKIMISSDSGLSRQAP